jgi:hypothetical protein
MTMAFRRTLATLLLLLAPAACTLGWHHGGGEPRLTTGETLVLPADWHWCGRGDALMATRDGVFLENVLVEPIHVDANEQSIEGMFPIAALSSKQWPIRTAAHLQRRFTAGMAPTDAAEVLLDSRRNDPCVTDLEVREVESVQIAGQPGFRVVFDFRLKPSAPGDLEWGAYGWSEFNVQNRRPAYRTIYYGFIAGEWFHGVACTAARRHYFDRDAAAFTAIVQRLRFEEVRAPPRDDS